MPKVIPIASHDHFADYAVQYCELQKPPAPDYKAANRKTRRDYIEDGFWILVAILVCYVVSRVRS